VAAWTYTPFSYRIDIAMPSIFSSHTYFVSPPMLRMIRSPHARSSSSLNALSSDIIGTLCVTGAKSDDGAAPTSCVGESAVTSSGLASSSARISRTSSSYSASEMTGSSSA
jgi:hypothetical protein